MKGKLDNATYEAEKLKMSKIKSICSLKSRIAEFEFKLIEYEHNAAHITQELEKARKSLETLED